MNQLSKRASVVCALLAIALLAASASAAESKVAGSQARVLAPAPGAFFAGGQLRVAIRVPGNGFHVWLGRREITAAFERRGKLRVAELDRSRLRPGVQHLYVKAGGRKGHFDSVRFVVGGRRAPGLLDTAEPRLYGQLGPAAITARRPARASMHAYLNGRRLRGEFDHVAAGKFRASLGADEGARFGRNVLRLLAFDEAGSYDVETIHFQLSKRRPLASAGPDRRTWARQRLRLDARASRPRAGIGGAELEYRWRVVGAPRGIEGRAAASGLRRANSARPLFRPPQAGTWKLAVTVRAPDGAVSRDLTTVESVPADPPIGAALRTIADSNGRIDVAGQPLPGTGTAGSTISYAMLSRPTRQPAKVCAGTTAPTGSVASSAAGIATLQQLAKTCGQPSYMLILAGTHGVPTATLDQFGDLLAGVGGAPLSATDRSRLAAGASFSTIGVPTAAAGSAFLNVGRQTSASRDRPLPAGALSGFLQYLTATREYGFVFPDYIPFETQAAHTEQSNTMTINGVEYYKGIDSGSAGFHVVVLDPSSAQPRKVTVTEFYEDVEVDINFAWPTDTTSPTEDQQYLENLANFLEDHVIKDNGLLFMQSIGTPSPTGPAWDRIAQMIEKLGGSRTVFDEIAKQGYAVVGSREVGLTEASASLTNNPADGHLAGVLARTRSTAFGPHTGSSVAAPSQEMMRILYQPAQPFPAFAKAGESSADEYIAKQLFGEGTEGGVRLQYWQSWGASWENKNQQMRTQVPYPGEAKCGCKEAEFEAVKAALGAEMTKLADVQNWIGKLSSTLDPTQSAFDLREIGHTIERLVQPPEREVGSSGLRMMSNAIALMGKVDERAAEVSEGGAALFEFLGGLQTGGDGSPILGELKAKTSDLGGQLFPRFELARGGLVKAGMIAASDWGKLQALAKKATGDWKITDPTPFRTAINKAAKRWFYSELMKTAWIAWQLGVPNARNWDCLTGGGEASKTNYPFSEEPESGQYKAAVGLGADLKPATIVRALGVHSTFDHRKSVDDSSAQPPSAALTDPLFQPANLDPSSPGLGLYPQQFYELNFERAWPPVSSGRFCDS